MRADRQSEACASVLSGGGGVGLANGLEDSRQKIRCNTDAGIRDLKANDRVAAADFVAGCSNESSPASVNLTALPTRLIRTCLTRPGSPRTPAGTDPSTTDDSARAPWPRRSTRQTDR